ncbi:multicopper oxidase domain-containing protein [Parafrigoribacterium mesophilum]|uniref:multicopper oxidase family protein n=1 Tax=Parafrigoribacterium mesophilum TaxID=433646 RepID=UPI0031FBC19B
MAQFSSRFRRPRATAMTVAVTAVTAAALTALSGCGAIPRLLPGAGPINTIGNVEFDTPLAIPPLAASTIDTSGRRVFDLTAHQAVSHFLPGKDTTTWRFASEDADQSYLGPTLRAARGEDVVVNVHNRLPEETTVHWHGMHLPARMDGGPHQMIEPGADWSPSWTIDQPAATLWYHPHPHGATEKHVTMGLAGMFIIDDRIEAALPLPRDYGVDDVPLIVQDARFGEDGALTTDTRGFIGPIGDQLLVNGTLGPYLDVTTDVVRLRLLNASAGRIFNFRLSDGHDLALIGTDGGLTEQPYETEQIQLSPGERAEVLVRMTPGETVTLRSTGPDLGLPDAIAGRNAGNDSFDVLELRASAALASVGTIPARLVPMDRIAQSDASVRREFRLEGFVINNEPMRMDRIDEVVTVGDTELWSVTNGMSMPHGFHVHDVQFQVASVGGRPPSPELAGWKDTIYLRPDTEYRLLMRFTDYTDSDFPYMYHCHLLWHEDRGMMGQFVVVKPGQSAGTPPTKHDQNSSTDREGQGHDHH